MGCGCTKGAPLSKGGTPFKGTVNPGLPSHRDSLTGTLNSPPAEKKISKRSSGLPAVDIKQQRVKSITEEPDITTPPVVVCELDVKDLAPSFSREENKEVLPGMPFIVPPPLSGRYASPESVAALSNALAVLDATRIAAEQALSAAISAEQVARAAADSDLNSSITAEQVARAAADSDLDLSKQQASLILSALSALSPSANTISYFTGATSVALAVISAAALSLLDDSDAAAMRATIGVTAYGVDIDFGNSVAINGEFTITHVGATVGQLVTAVQSSDAAAGEDPDEAAMDALIISGRVSSPNTIIFYVASVHGPVTGKYRINYRLN